MHSLKVLKNIQYHGSLFGDLKFLSLGFTFEWLELPPLDGFFLVFGSFPKFLVLSSFLLGLDKIFESYSLGFLFLCI